MKGRWRAPAWLWSVPSVWSMRGRPDSDGAAVLLERLSGSSCRATFKRASRRWCTVLLEIGRTLRRVRELQGAVVNRGPLQAHEVTEIVLIHTPWLLGALFWPA